MVDSENTTETDPAVASTTGTEASIDFDTVSTIPTTDTTEREVIDIDNVDNALAPFGTEGAEEKKPGVKHRVSFDETDEITPSYIEEEEAINLDHIHDPDAAPTAENIFGVPRGELGPPVHISSSEHSVEEEEDRTSDIITYLAELGQQTKEPINREAYEEEFKILKGDAVNLRRKNGLLHRKIGEYYKKRKINRVFQDIPIEDYESTLDRYETKAIDLHDLMERVTREKEAISNELKDMRNLRDEHKDELDENFTSMLEREQEVGHGLIDSRTGKVISDKLIERLAFRQKAKSDEIAVIRLNYIKRGDKVKEIEAKIKSLETIDGTLHLMDFEQLRMENQTYTDKIEERDEELMRLRGRYSHAMQALAHIREKINIIQVQIDNLQDKKIGEESIVNRTREMLNNLKIQRDSNRAHNAKLKNTTGILTYPKLLLDMEKEMNMIEQLTDQLEKLKEKNKEDRKKLLNIRVVMERTGHARERKYNKKTKTFKGNKRYQNYRPSLTYPLESHIAQLRTKINDLNIDYT